MSEIIEINGGVPLKGEVLISGAKNAALPMLLASLMTSEECQFSNVPNLEDITLTIRLLEHFGAEVNRSGSTVRVRVPNLIATEASYSIVKSLRASFWVLGPTLARGGAARVALPGGDVIGTRPVNIHLSSLEKMGADIKLMHGVVLATAQRGLKAADIEFEFPSVGATHQIMMAASLTPGTTVIRGAAREPEVVALANLLNLMGAEIEGAGTAIVSIKGRSELGGASVELIGDRVEAGTYLLAGAISRGDITVKSIDPSFLGNFLEILSDIGFTVSTTETSVRVRGGESVRPVYISTAPFPGLATDLQAPLMALLATVPGVSTIEETIFEARFSHASELARMGANIEINDRLAKIAGVPKLSGAPVDGYDIRGAAALVVAGIGAEGITQIGESQHLRRGYEKLESKLGSLGAIVRTRKQEAEDIMFIGC